MVGICNLYANPSSKKNPKITLHHKIFFIQRIHNNNQLCSLHLGIINLGDKWTLTSSDHIKTRSISIFFYFEWLAGIERVAEDRLAHQFLPVGNVADVSDRVESARGVLSGKLERLQDF